MKETLKFLRDLKRNNNREWFAANRERYEHALQYTRSLTQELIDRIAEIEKAASKTIFKGSDVWLFDSIDFGEYSLGSELKRELLAGEFSYGIPEE